MKREKERLRRDQKHFPWLSFASPILAAADPAHHSLHTTTAIPPPTSHTKQFALEMSQYVYNLQDFRTITLQFAFLYTCCHHSKWMPTTPSSRGLERKIGKTISSAKDYNKDTGTVEWIYKTQKNSGNKELMWY
jgi:hypothetical protein